MSRINKVDWLLQAIAATVCLAVIVPIVVAQDSKAPDEEKSETKTEEKASDEKQDASDEKEDADEPLFSVPDGMAEELFDFIDEVKRTRPKGKTREAVMEHVKLQINAVVEACEKIRISEPGDELEVRAIKEEMGALTALMRYDSQTAAPKLKTLMADIESDERPVIAKLVRSEKLKQKAAAVRGMSDSERSEFIDELFSVADEDGLDREIYGLLSNIGRALASSDDPEVGAKMYERLADAMEKSEEESLSVRADRTRGAARRLRLPGKFMELKGTTADGEEFNWDEYRGKVVLVDFWASWCGPCRAEIPNMKDQLEKYEDKGFAIVGVNLDKTKKAYQKYVDDQELTWTNLMSDNEDEMGWDNPIATRYGVNGIPTAILVDKDGKVVSMSARGKNLNKELDKLLGSDEEPDEESEESDEKSDTATEDK